MSAPTRRDVFVLTANAAALAASGRLPLLGAAAPIPAAVSAVEGYLSANAPGAGAKGARKLEYALLRWTETDPSTGRTKNVEMGRLEIGIAPGNGAVRLSIRQHTSYPRPVNRLEADAVCEPGGLLGLRSWSVKSWIEGRDDCEYAAKGEFSGGIVRIDDGLGERKFAAQGPLVGLWNLPAAAAAGSLASGAFTLLDEFLLHKAGQRLAAGPSIGVPYRDGERRLASWAHTGPGVMPIHYLVDEQGLPQMMTQGVVAWALQRAS